MKMQECVGSSTLTLSSEHAEESVQKNRRQLQEQIQIKSDSLSIIFQMIYTLEYVSNSARVDLAEHEHLLQNASLIDFRGNSFSKYLVSEKSNFYIEASIIFLLK